MGDGLFHGSEFMVQLPCSNLLKNQFKKPLGPSLGVNRMWTKKNGHAPRSKMCWFFYIYASKKAILKRKKNLTIFLSSLGFHLSSHLLKCVKDVACKSSHNNSYKKNERFNLYMFDVIYMWYVPCVVHWALCCNLLHQVYSNSWVLDVPHCLMKHVGVSVRGRAWKKWYVSWAMI
jgi:hypothetical protein